MDINTNKNGETPVQNTPQNPSQPADGQAGQPRQLGTEMPGHSFADVRNARQRSRSNPGNSSDRRSSEPRPDNNRQQRPSSRQYRPGDRPDARAQQIGQVQGQRRRRRHRNYIIYYILLGAIMTIVCVTLSLTVFFNITKLNTSGSSVYSSEEILAAVNARKGDNLLRLNVGKLESQALETLTSAESVEIKRHFPDQLDIIVTDGDPVLQVSFGGMFYQFTESGRLIGVTETAAVDGQVVEGPDPTGLEVGQYMDGLGAEQQESFSTWRTIRDALYNYSIQDISAMQLSDPLQLRIYYQNRIEINLGTLTEMDIKIATLKSILYDSGSVGVDEMGVIDLTNPDRVYFNNQASCVLPAGAGQPGWSWVDPYSETLEESLYQSQQPEETEDPEQQDGTEEGSGETTEGGEQGESQTSEESSSSETQDDGQSYATSDGMILPLMPSQPGSAGSSANSGGTASSSSTGDTGASTGNTDTTSSETSGEESQTSSQPQVGTVNGASGQGSTGSGVGTQTPSVPGISG